MKATVAQGGTGAKEVQREVVLGLALFSPHFKDNKDFSMFADKEKPTTIKGGESNDAPGVSALWSSVQRREDLQRRRRAFKCQRVSPGEEGSC